MFPVKRVMFEESLASRLKERRGEPYRPSNGMEGEIFYANWCADCEHDAMFRLDPDNADGCQIFARTLWTDVNDPAYPKEWAYGEDGQPKCTGHSSVQPPGRCDKTLDLFATADTKKVDHD